jgi:hypothetical protein
MQIISLVNNALSLIILIFLSNAFLFSLRVAVDYRLSSNIKECEKIPIMDGIEVINKTTFCDLTRFSSIELSLRIENFGSLKIYSCDFNLTDSIKM